MTRGAAKADAKLAVKSKRAERPVRGRSGKAGKDPVKGSKGKAAMTFSKEFPEVFDNDPNPNRPKRPPSAFYVFLEDFRKQYTGCTAPGPFGKAAGDRWRSLGKEGQATYRANAKQQLHEYKKAMAVYKGESPPASPPASEEEEEEEEESDSSDEDDEFEDDDE